MQSYFYLKQTILLKDGGYMHILSIKKIQNCYAKRQGLRDKDL